MNYKVINHTNNKMVLLNDKLYKIKKVLNALCNVLNMKIVCPKFMAKVLLEITTPKFHTIISPAQPCHFQLSKPTHFDLLS